MKKVNNIIKILIILILIITNCKSIAYATGAQASNPNISTDTNSTPYAAGQQSNDNKNNNSTPWENFMKALRPVINSPLANEETREAMITVAKVSAQTLISSPIVSTAQGDWETLIFGPIATNTKREEEKRKNEAAAQQAANKSNVSSQVAKSEERKSSTNHTVGEVIEEADGFIKRGQKDSDSIITKDDLKNLSNTIYNILLVLAMVIAVILGAILGIKFITEGVEGKAEIKKALIPYILGCVIVFGSFTIWKVVVTIFQQIEQIQ